MMLAAFVRQNAEIIEKPELLGIGLGALGNFHQTRFDVNSHIFLGHACDLEDVKIQNMCGLQTLKWRE